MGLWEAPAGTVQHFGNHKTPDEGGDSVNHPSHYTQYDGFEVIDITEQLDFLRGNAVKYILRALDKSNPAEDIDKAIWYLERFKKNLSD